MEYPHPLIETLLFEFQSIIDTDYEKYRNHVYRVFLNCCLLDDDKAHEELYAIAAVFHDIGIWTDHTIDYLAPSIAQAVQYLSTSGNRHATGTVSQMIYWHHKISRYRGEFETTVGTFRKADWIDVSLGLLNFGADKQKIKANKQKLPNRGFHLFLVKQTGKNFLRHPLNLIPVFKK